RRTSKASSVPPIVTQLRDTSSPGTGKGQHRNRQSLTKPPTSCAASPLWNSSQPVTSTRGIPGPPEDTSTQFVFREPCTGTPTFRLPAAVKETTALTSSSSWPRNGQARSSRSTSTDGFEPRPGGGVSRCSQPILLPRARAWTASSFHGEVVAPESPPSYSAKSSVRTTPISRGTQDAST